MIRIVALSALTLLAACSPQKEADPQPAPVAIAAATPAAPEPAPVAVPGRAYRFTSLTGCRVVREEREEMPFVETLCPGAGAWNVKIADSDARQSLTLVGPDEEHKIEVGRIGGGGFSSFGKTAEWRGASAEPFEPDSLIVHFQVAEQPYPAPETSYLLVIKLGRAPCVIAKVPPGPRQNDSARVAAGRPGACLPV